MEVFENLRRWWRGLGGGTRFFVVFGMILVVAALGAFVYLRPGDTFVAVGPDMPVEEVQAVRARLTTLGIPNELDKRGVNVRVPEEQLAAARVGLAAEGLPSRGGKGLESFDDTSFGATPFQENVKYQRALQNELARSISTLDAVAAARVMIARPDPTPFIRDQRAPTASVVLRLRPNVQFGKANAAAIVSLVARAVDGLKPENVTVVEASGKLLSDPYAGHKDDLPGEMVDYRKGLEQYLAQKAQDLLNQALAGKRAVVTVNTDLNYQKVKEKQIQYAPDGKVVKMERTTNSKSTTASARGGITGMTSNAARPGGSAGGGGSGRSEDEEIQTDYLNSVTEREMEDRPGMITRITVAAVVDLNGPPPAEGEQPAPAMTLDEVRDIIKNAIGFKPDRDEIKVTAGKFSIPVAPPEIDEETPRLQRMQTYVGLARNISIAFAAVMAFAIIPLALLRRRAADKAALPPPPPTPEQLAQGVRDRRRQQVERLIELTRVQPETVADVFGLLASK